MILFISTFLLLYAFLHAIVFWGIYPLLKGRKPLILIIIFLMAIMSTAPLLIKAFERKGLFDAAEATAWVGYVWMGAAYVAFSIFFVLAVWELAVYLLDFAFEDFSRFSIRGRKCSMAVLIAVAAVCVWGWFEAHNIVVERIEIKSEKLPAGSEPLVIAQISDVHLGLLRCEKLLMEIISMLEAENPDILFCTGDMVDAEIDKLNGLSEIWNRYQPPLGKFAVTGNHEYYAGLAKAVEFHTESGFTVLRGWSEPAGQRLLVAGVDDPAGNSASEEILLFDCRSKDRFTVLLKHRPTVDPISAGLFDLQLSGHSHRGQIFPFALITRLKYPLQNGLYELEGGSFLYTSRGTGTWGPPMRVLSPPEITIFTIKPAE